MRTVCGSNERSVLRSRIGEAAHCPVSLLGYYPLSCPLLAWDILWLTHTVTLVRLTLVNPREKTAQRRASAIDEETSGSLDVR